MARSSADDDVVARAKLGDEAAWRELYEANAGRLIVWLNCHPSGDVAATGGDTAADAWLTAARKIADFSGDSSDFAGWLFSVARNIALNTRRRTIRRGTSPVAAAAEDSAVWGATPDPSSRVDGVDWTRRLLAELPQREAEVVACIDVVGLDVSVTSQALGISPTAVRVSHHRGLSRLRGILSAPGQLRAVPRYP